MSESIPYYVVKNGNGFWEPKHRMRDLGFAPVRCGPDGDAAKEVARSWNARWQEARRQVRTEPASPPGKRGYIYFLRAGDRVKIGFSLNPFTRTAGVKNGMSEAVQSIVAVRGTVADERYLHQRLSSFRRTGEWFVASAIVLREMHRAAAFGRVITTTGTPMKT